MGWFTNLVVIMSCVAGGLVLYPVQIVDAGRGEQAGVTLSGIVRLVHLLSFATAFGTSLWASFIGGIIMFKSVILHSPLCVRFLKSSMLFGKSAMCLMEFFGLSFSALTLPLSNQLSQFG